MTAPGTIIWNEGFTSGEDNPLHVVGGQVEVCNLYAADVCLHRAVTTGNDVPELVHVDLDALLQGMVQGRVGVADDITAGNPVSSHPGTPAEVAAALRRWLGWIESGALAALPSTRREIGSTVAMLDSLAATEPEDAR